MLQLVLYRGMPVGMKHVLGDSLGTTQPQVHIMNFLLITIKFAKLNPLIPLYNTRSQQKHIRLMRYNELSFI